jgi:hypothetical protein
MFETISRPAVFNNGLAGDRVTGVEIEADLEECPIT